MARENTKGRVRRLFCCRLLPLALLLVPLFLFLPAPAWASTIGEAKRGVVCIFSADDLEDPETCGTGSGFGVGTVGQETDIFVTNRHVVFDEDTGAACQEIYILLADGAVTYHQDGDDFYMEYDREQMIRCELLYPKEGDPEYPDIAILRAERKVEGRHALPMRKTEKDSSSDGMRVYAIGYPGSADSMRTRWGEDSATQPQSASAESSTLTEGSISRTFRMPEADDTYVIQHTAQINSGNSGGPLLTEEGEVIGINTYGYMYEDSNVTEYKLAIFSEYAMRVLDQLGLPYNDYPASTPSLLSYAYYLLAAASAVLALLAVLLILFLRRGAARRGAQAVSQAAAENPLPALPVLPAPPAEALPADPAAATMPAPASAQEPVPAGMPEEEIPVTAPLPMGQGMGQDGAVPKAFPADQWRIYGTYGYFKNRCFAVTRTMRIGRDPGRSELLFPMETAGISALHCQLLLQEDALYLEDLGSSFGTCCQDAPLQPGQRVRLQAGDEFCLGRKTQGFRVVLRELQGGGAGGYRGGWHGESHAGYAERSAGA